MGSRTQDPNTFLLTPLIVSALTPKTSNECPENDEPNGTDLCGKETNELRFKRFFCSASRVPDELMAEIVEQCKLDPAFLEAISQNVFNDKMVTSHAIRYQFQTNVIKSLISELEKNNVAVPDAMFERLGTLMSMKDGEFVERLYLNEAGDGVLAKFNEAVNQLSLGTTGLSVWQASADLANLFRLVPKKSFKRVVELGAGCGVSGIAIAKIHGCGVVLTDYDENVLDLLRENAERNDLMKQDPEAPEEAPQVKVSCLDWCDFALCDWKEQADLIIAADVVYDTALLASLCSVLRLLLRNSCAALIACTRRNPASLECFEHHLKNSKLEIIEKIEYENGEYLVQGDRFEHPSIFPFHSTLKTPTIFYNIQPK